MNGLWSADDLTTALRIMALNRDSFERLDKGWSKILAPLKRIWHFLRKNTRSGSRKNIVAHYDLGNDFYRLFLDDTLTYSCGIFDVDGSTMRDAKCVGTELGDTSMLNVDITKVDFSGANIADLPTDFVRGWETITCNDDTKMPTGTACRDGKPGAPQQ